MRDPFSSASVRAAYDTVAEDYTAAFADDLANLPLDREILDALPSRVPNGALVADLGCGPAPVCSYLQAHGVAMIGLDLSRRILEVAARRVPNLPLVQADLRNLPFRNRSLAAAVGYYAIQHLARTDLPDVLIEIRRVLNAEALLVLAAHLGEGERYIDDFLGHHVNPLGGSLYQLDELLTILQSAGFSIDVLAERGPLAHEADTQRVYLVAVRP